MEIAFGVRGDALRAEQKVDYLGIRASSLASPRPGALFSIRQQQFNKLLYCPSKKQLSFIANRLASSPPLRAAAFHANLIIQNFGRLRSGVDDPISAESELRPRNEISHAPKSSIVYNQPKIPRAHSRRPSRSAADAFFRLPRLRCRFRRSNK